MRHEVLSKKWLAGYDVDFSIPATLEELKAKLWSVDPKTHHCVILIGGDGTMNQSLSSLMGRKIPLLLIPGGTANDLVDELGMWIQWEDVPALIEADKKEFIDLIQVNGQPFATVGGIGFGALLTLQFNALRAKYKPINWMAKKLKNQIYTFLSVEQIFLQNSYKQKVRVSGENYHGIHSTSAIFVCNQQKLGGDLWVAPHARNNDGFFDVLIIPYTSTKDILKVFTEIKRGRPAEGTINFTSSKITIESISGDPLCVFGDGETLTKASKLDFNLLSSALCVYRSNALTRLREMERQIL